MKIESKVSFCKTRNTFQAKITIPNRIVNELGITSDENEILMELQKNKLIITKKETDMYFVGGYWDDRIITLYEDSKLELLKNPMIYNLEEVLDLAFVENVKDEVENFDDLSIEEQANAILKYVNYDDLATLKYFNNKQDAEIYLKSCITEINDVDKFINNGYLTLIEQTQDNEGYYHDVYKHLTERSIVDYSISSVQIGDILLLNELIDKVTNEYAGLLSADDCYDLYLENTSVAFSLEKRYPSSYFEGWNVMFKLLDENERLIEVTDIYAI